MKNYLPFYFLLLVLISQKSNAQNLVPNGDFESYTACPTSANYYSDLATGWSFINNHGGTSDYFNTCATISDPLHDDTNFGGDETPFNGEGYIGMSVYDAFDQREYAMVRLSSPLVAGQQYDVSAYVSAGTKDFASVLYCNNIGIHLSVNMPTVSGCGMCVGVYNGAPHVNETSIVTTSNGWHQISNTITAVGGEEWLILGNFFNNAATNIQLTGNTCMGGCFSAYYYFDEVRVELTQILPIELQNFEGKCQLGKINLDWITAMEEGNSGFEIQRLESNSGGGTWEKIGMVASKGNSISSTSYKFEDNNPQSGINYYRLKQLDWSGDFSYSSIIAIDYLVCNSSFVDQIFPNPANQFLTVVSKEGIPIIRLFDKIGQQVYVCPVVEGNQSKLDVSTLPSGVYTLQTIRDRTVKAYKIVIE